MFKKLFIVLFLLLYATASFAEITMQEYNAVKKDLAYVENSKNTTRTSYVLVAEKFYNLYKKDPSSRLADDSLYLCGKTYLKSYEKFKNKDDLRNALKYFRLAAVNYDTKWAAQSYLYAADIYVMLDDYASARYMLNKLIAKFNNFPEAKEAKKKLSKIEDKFLTYKAPSPSKKESANNPPKSNSGKIEIENIRYFSSDDYTRVVIDLN